MITDATQPVPPPERHTFANGMFLLQQACLDLVNENEEEFKAEDGDDFDPSSFAEDRATILAMTSTDQIYAWLTEYGFEGTDIANFVFYSLTDIPLQEEQSND